MTRRQRIDLQFSLGLCAALALLAAFIVSIHLSTETTPAFPPAAVRSLASPSHVVSK